MGRIALAALTALLLLPLLIAPRQGRMTWMSRWCS